jgi:uncharacterized protein (DUF58 family)
VGGRQLAAGVGVPLVLALVLPGVAAKAVALGLVALLAILAAWTAILRRALDVGLVLPERLVHGEEVDLAVTVVNPSRLPAPRVRVEVTLPGWGFTPSEAVFEVALPPRRSVTLTSPVAGYGRGHWQARTIVARLTDPWGLYRGEVSFPPPPATMVLPRVVPVRRLELPAVAPLAELPDRRALSTDPMAIVGVRPYTPGDPLRSIHWPATAASGTLVRRETERAWARDLLVVLDLDDRGWERDDQHSFEVAVTTAASLLVDAVLTQRQPAGLIVSQPAGPADPGPPLPGGTVTAGGTAIAGGTATAGSTVTAGAAPARFRVAGSRSHLDTLLVHLAAARRHAGLPLAELLRRHVRTHQPGTTVAVVTGRVAPDLAGPLRRLRGAGLAPVLLQVAHPRALSVGDRVPTGGTLRLTVRTDQTLTRLVL